MTALARIFAALSLLALIGAAAAMIWLRPAAPLPDLPPLTGPVDHILIEKSARRMTLFKGGQAVRRYPVALGFSPAGDKSVQGDGRTPEGTFRIDRRNDQSAYHLSLGLDYPQADDLIRAAAAGIDPGGDIMIHGQPNALPDGTVLKGDWTAGCIAVSDTQMREIWQVTPVGTTVEIRP